VGGKITVRIDIVNGSIVTGDGESFLENTSLIIKDGFIDDLPSVRYIPYNAYADRVIDAKGGLIIPGVINIHAHGISFGPFFPYAWKRLSKERVLNYLDTHLLQGTTTMLNNDGIALPSEVEAVNKIHPVNIRMCTLHTPKNIRAAEVISGDGIEDRHRRFTAEEAVALGAVALGEVGAPGTSYGTYEKGIKIGKVISAQHALALDKAVLAGDEHAIGSALVEAGLEEMTLDQAKKLVEETSVIPVQACCDAIRESVTYVRKLGIPVLAHSEPGMKDALLEVAKELGPQLIATHVNHSFTPDESVSFAKELKGLGATIEIITADSFGAKQVEASPEGTFALLKEGLVDVITTDFSGGYHDPILFVLQKAIEKEFITLSRAVQLATSAPARIIPGVAPNRGLVEPGKVADLCIVDGDDLSTVRYVIIGGRIVVEDGRLAHTHRDI
jgi:imidazolonepropionase-like amidohydrolase